MTPTIEETGARVWPAPNEHGVFDPADCQQIFSGFDCKVHVIEQSDGWRASVEATLPSGSMGSYPAVSHPEYPSRPEAILSALELLIVWLSDQKEHGSKKHQKAAAKLQDWALDLIAREKHRTPEGAAPVQTITIYRKDDPTSPAHPEVAAPSSQDQPTANAPVLYAHANLSGELKLIPITELFESPDNPRQHYPEAAMNELVESMKQSGFRPWLPLLVRPCGQSSAIWRQLGDVGGYEIGAGHRRRRAAELAGIQLVPCIIASMTQEQFLDVLNFDNSGREDVHPLHEAAGWAKWMQETGKGVLDIAAKIGKSKEYVYQRLKYSELSGDAQAAFLDGKIMAGHAIQLARRKDQPRWLKFCLTPVNYSGVLPSTRQLIEALHQGAYIDLRDNCPFDRTDKTLLSGAGDCGACPKRAANIPGFEFEEDNSGADLCTDRVCHGQKVDNHLYRIRADIYTSEGHYPLQVSNLWSTKKKGVYPRGDWDAVKAGDKGAQTAVVVEGDDTGQVIQVRRKSSAPAPSPESGLSQPAKPSTSNKADQDHRAAAQRDKEKAAEERELGVRRQILQAVTAKMAGLNRADLEALLLFVLNTGEEARELCLLHDVKFSPGMAEKTLCGALPKMKDAELFQLAVELPVAGELDSWSWNRPAKNLEVLAKRYRVDAGAIRKAAEKAAKQAETPARPEDKPKPAVPGKKLTAATRKKIGAANKTRWAAFKKTQPLAPKPTKKKKAAKAGKKGV